MPNKTMKSMSGHTKDEEINRYTEAANQQRLARAAVERLSDWELSPPEEREDVLASAAIEALARWEAEGPMSNPDGR